MGKLVMWLACLGLLADLAQGFSLIETYQLFAWLQQGRALHVVEVCGVAEAEPQSQQHLPNAKRISLKDLSDLSMWPILKTPRQDVFIQLMKAYGIKKDTTEVVLYDSSGVLYSAKAWWVFTVFGRTHVQVLNGGLPKWIREGYATTPAISGPNPTALHLDSDYLYQLDMSRNWNMQELSALVGVLQSTAPAPPVQLIDVRMKGDFDAKNVKGSINMPIDIARRADGTLRSAVELKVIFQMYAVRTTNETLTVVIGMNGVDSSTALLSLAVVGSSHSAMVDGGWVEYSSWLKAAPTAVFQQSHETDYSGGEKGLPTWWITGLGALMVLGIATMTLKRRHFVAYNTQKWL